VPLSGAKEPFCCSVYYIILISNCEAQRASKNFKKCKPKLMHERN
jgi:hypothetical protein